MPKQLIKSTAAARAVGQVNSRCTIVLNLETLTHAKLKNTNKDENVLGPILF